MDEILNLIESVSEGFPSYFFKFVTNSRRHEGQCDVTNQHVTNLKVMRLYAQFHVLFCQNFSYPSVNGI